MSPFVERQKNDARAIFEASSRIGIHFVPVKSVELKDLKAIRSVRKRLVENRTALANHIRVFAAEYDIVFPFLLKHYDVICRSRLKMQRMSYLM